jgi:hypothetical protein
MVVVRTLHNCMKMCESITRITVINSQLSVVLLPQSPQVSKDTMLFVIPLCLSFDLSSYSATFYCFLISLVGYSLFGGLGGTTGGRERGFGLDVSCAFQEKMLLHYTIALT